MMENICDLGDIDCLRQVASNQYEKVKGVVDAKLAQLGIELATARNLKKHPHSCVYLEVFNADENTLQNADDLMLNTIKDAVVLQGNVEQTNTKITDIPLQIYSRTVDIIDNMDNSINNNNVNIISGIVDSCLKYQIQLEDALNIVVYLERSLKNLTQAHKEYDDIIQKMRFDGAQACLRVDGVNKTVSESIDYKQNEMTQIVNQIQRLTNQLPWQVANIRAENEFMEIYNREDDTIKIHNFLMSDYVRMIISKSGSPQLEKAWSTLKHLWTSFDEA